MIDKKRLLYILPALLVVFLFIIPSFLYFTPGIGNYVCGRCAVELHLNGYFCDPESGCAFGDKEVTETPMSRLLSDNFLVQEHQHQWFIENYKMNGSRACFSYGSRFSLFVRNERAKFFIEKLIEIDEVDAKRWIAFGLNPHTSRYLQDFIFSEELFPFNSEEGANEFEEWWEDGESSLRAYIMSRDSKLEILTSDDGFDSIPRAISNVNVNIHK